MPRQVTPDLKEIDEMSPFLEVLTPKQCEYLKKNYELKRYKKNDVVYSEGETPMDLLCLVQGKVKIYRGGVGGRLQIMRILTATEYFGYRALLAEEPYVTGAIAIEPTVIYRVPGEVFVELMKENNDLAFYFIKALAVDLGISDARSTTLTQKHIRGRLAESLIFLKTTYGYEEDGATISVYLSREDLASLSNMTTSNAIRTLTAFANERIITVDGRKIKIIDEEKLNKISKSG